MKKLFLCLALLLMPIKGVGAFIFEDDYDAIFSDFRSSDQYAEGVFLLYDIGIISGNGDGSFAAERPLNRAELSKILVNAVFFEDFEDEGICFEDLKVNAWYVKYVCKAKDLGLVFGYEGNVFKPSGTTTLAEGLSVLNQAFDWGVDTDKDEVWYLPLLNEAEKRNIIEGGLEYDLLLTRGFFSDILAKEIVNNDLRQGVFEGFEPYYDWARENLRNNEELSNFIDEFYGDKDNYFDRHSSTDGHIFALFEIDENDDLILVEGVDNDDFQLMWSNFSDLFPKNYRMNLKEFAVFSDGFDRTLAYVEQGTKDSEDWLIAIDYQDMKAEGFDSPEFVLTMIHEFGHLITLNAEQVPPNEYVYLNEVDNDEFWSLILECRPRYFPGEGCAKENSYINVFYQEFWKDLEGEYDEILLTESRRDYDRELDAFYDKYKDRFVTYYAVTNPAEDIAESWTAFVIEDKPESNTIADEKILFFYRYPVFLEMRDYLRSVLVE